MTSAAAIGVAIGELAFSEVKKFDPIGRIERGVKREFDSLFPHGPATEQKRPHATAPPAKRTKSAPSRSMGVTHYNELRNGRNARQDRAAGRRKRSRSRSRPRRIKRARTTRKRSRSRKRAPSRRRPLRRSRTGSRVSRTSVVQTVKRVLAAQNPVRLKYRTLLPCTHAEEVKSDVVATGLGWCQGGMTQYADEDCVPQTEASSTWDLTNLSFPLVALGDADDERTADHLQLVSMKNRHAVKIVWPIISITLAPEEFTTMSVTCVEWIVKMRSENEFTDWNSDACTDLFMELFNIRNKNAPQEPGGTTAVRNRLRPLNSATTVLQTDWKLSPKLPLNKLAAGVVEARAAAPRVVRERIRTFARPRPSQNVFVDTADVIQISPAERHVVCGFSFKPKGSGKVTFKGDTIVPRKGGYKYVQAWYFHSPNLTTPTLAHCPIIHVDGGHVAVKFRDM